MEIAMYGCMAFAMLSLVLLLIAAFKWCEQALVEGLGEFYNAWFGRSIACALCLAFWTIAGIACLEYV